MWRLRQWLKRLAQKWLTRQAEFRTWRIERQWRARSQRLPRSVEGKVLLHIGCGDINASGFINIDARPQPHVHILTTNLHRLAMIPDNTADLIYMSHVLEHVSHRDMVSTLREMRRMLKTGGVLRISVPDFDHILTIYQATGHDIIPIQQPLMGGQDYPFNFHYTVLNDAYLRKMMMNSGFRETRAWNPHDCENRNFEDWASMKISWDGHDYEISLNIEAVK